MVGSVTTVATRVLPMAADDKDKPKDPAPPKDDDKKAEKPDAPAAPDPKPAKAPERELVNSVYLQLGTQADLRSISELPVGVERISSAVNEMRSTASRTQDQTIQAVRAQIEQMGAPLEAEVGDRLWINNSMVVDIYKKPTKGMDLGALLGLSSSASDDQIASKVVDMVGGIDGVQNAKATDAMTFNIPKIDSFAVDGRGPLNDARNGAADAQGDNLPWNLDVIGVKAAWDAGITGKGVTVASVDTGVDVEHPALWSSYRGYSRQDGFDHQRNYFDSEVDAKKPGEARKDPVDDHGHGTHVTGSMVGDDGTGAPIGVAPDAQFVAARGLGAQGGTTLGLLKSMQYLMAPVDDWSQGDAATAPSIINHSWGGPGPSLDFTQAIRNMAKAGVVNVFAAGNNGYAADSQTLGDPGMQDYGISVAAADRNGQIAKFSSKGPSNVTDEPNPFVSAPGVDVVSSVPGGKYAAFSGTSMAAPHVSGALALVNQSLGDRGQSFMDLDDAKFVLKNMVTDIDVEGIDDASGHGMIDLNKMNDAVDKLVAAREAGVL